MGMAFKVVVLETVTVDQVRGREKFWICKLRQEGHPLTNREYGRVANTTPDDWEEMGSILHCIREAVNEAVVMACKMTGANHAGFRALDKARQQIDRARLALDTTLAKLHGEQSVCGVFYGRE